MNTIRDPFSIRNKPNFNPALQILRQQTVRHVHAAQNAAQSFSEEVQKTTQSVVIPAVDSAVESAKEIAKDTLEQMSFSLPKNVPSFTAGQRDLENQAWSTRFGRQQKDLPLYKDKPYYSNSATVKQRRMVRKKRFIVLIAALVLGAYWFRLFPRQDVTPPVTGKPPPLQSAANWDERRERVKDVFVESWAAYERDAWGNTTPNRSPTSALTMLLVVHRLRYICSHQQKRPANGQPGSWLDNRRLARYVDDHEPDYTTFACPELGGTYPQL